MNFVIEHLSKHFEKKKVLRDISFTFESGKIYGLLGRNGAGKTTLFNCLNRDIKADGGSFWLEENGNRREAAVEDIGYVLSTPTVPEFLTGREFIKFFLDINEGSIQNPRSIDEYFDYMSIEPEDRDKLLKDYSHGMKNKMQMLVNIIAQPPLLLLDVNSGKELPCVHRILCMKQEQNTQKNRRYVYIVGERTAKKMAAFLCRQKGMSCWDEYENQLFVSGRRQL